MSQYGEPWVLSEQRGSGDMEPELTPHNADGNPIVDMFVGYEESEAPRISHAHRIVACVNACRDMDDDLVRDIDPPKLTAFVKAVGTLNPAGIPKLIEAVTKILQACHEAKSHGWEDHTNFTQTLETALEACYLTPPPDSVP